MGGQLKKSKRPATFEQIAESRRQRDIHREARRIQVQIDSNTLRDKLPELLDGMFAVDTDELYVDGIIVELTERWSSPSQSKITLLVKTNEEHFGLGTLRELASVTDKLGLTFSIQSDVNDRYGITLEILVARGKELSTEAIEQATKIVDDRARDEAGANA